jgi:hypothetical protein
LLGSNGGEYRLGGGRPASTKLCQVIESLHLCGTWKSPVRFGPEWYGSWHDNFYAPLSSFSVFLNDSQITFNKAVQNAAGTHAYLTPPCPSHLQPRRQSAAPRISWESGSAVVHHCALNPLTQLQSFDRLGCGWSASTALNPQSKYLRGNRLSDSGLSHFPASK